MHTDDLKELFAEQRADSRLTSDRVMRYIERKRNMRRGATAGIVSLAVIAVTIGSVWMTTRGDTNPIPATPVVTTPTPTGSPSPEPSPTETGVQEQSTQATDIQEPRPTASELRECTMEAPSSWNELLLSRTPRPGDRPWVQQNENDELVWNQGESSRTIATDADSLHAAARTDGRFVVYLTNNGMELKIWDSQAPEEPAWAPGVRLEEGSKVFLVDGLVWVLVREGANLPDEQREGTVLLINAGTDFGKTDRRMTSLMSERGLDAGHPYRGRLPVRVGDGPVQWLGADGSLEDPPEPLKDKVVLDAEGEVAIVADADNLEKTSLFHGTRGTLTPTDARSIQSEWLLGFEDDAAGKAHFWLFDWVQGVRVNLPDTSRGYELRDGYLWANDGDSVYVNFPIDLAKLPPIDLAKLPPGTCR